VEKIFSPTCVRKTCMKPAFNGKRSKICGTSAAVALMAILLVAACASPIRMSFSTAPTEIFYKDGRVAFIATCKSANWGPCLEQAGLICKAVGYTILQQDNQRSYGEMDKELVFSCNAK